MKAFFIASSFFVPAWDSFPAGLSKCTQHYDQTLFSPVHLLDRYCTVGPEPTNQAIIDNRLSTYISAFVKKKCWEAPGIVPIADDYRPAARSA
jgi:hypothetical protein